MEPAVIEIQVIANEAIAKLKTINEQLGVMQGQALKTGAAMGGFEKSMFLATRAFKVMGLAAVAVGYLSVKTAIDTETAFARMNKAMDGAGVGTAKNKEEAKALAENNVKLGFTIDDTALAYGTLVTATHSTGESQRLLNDAMDFARYKHIGLGTAATIMARGTQGSAKAFKELGITLDTSLPKQEAINKAFDELEQRLGGQSQAYLQTFGGKLAVLSAKSKALADTIGEFLIPYISKLVDFFTKFGKWILVALGLFTAWVVAMKLAAVVSTIASTANAYYAASVASVMVAQEALAAEMGVLMLVEGEMTIATRLSAGAMGMLNLAMDANPIGVVVLAVGALILALKTLFDWLNKNTDKTKELQQLGQHAATSGRGSTGLGGGYVSKAYDPMSGNMPDTASTIKRRLESYTGKVPTASNVATVVKSLMDLMKEEWQKQASVNVGSLFAPLLGIDANGNLTVTSKGMIRTSVSMWGKTVGTGIEGMITALKDKLAAAKKFNADLKKLLKEGFSIDFATEIMAQGVTVGDKIAQTLLHGTTKQKNQIITLYKQTKDEASQGFNKVPTVTNNHITVKAKTDAKPHNIAKDVVHAAKYGITQKGAKGDS